MSVPSSEHDKWLSSDHLAVHGDDESIEWSIAVDTVTSRCWGRTISVAGWQCRHTITAGLSRRRWAIFCQHDVTDVGSCDTADSRCDVTDDIIIRIIVLMIMAMTWRVVIISISTIHWRLLLLLLLLLWLSLSCIWASSTALCNKTISKCHQKSYSMSWIWNWTYSKCGFQLNEVVHYICKHESAFSSGETRSSPIHLWTGMMWH